MSEKTTIIHLERNAQTGQVEREREVTIDHGLPADVDMRGYEPFRKLSERTVGDRRMRISLKEAFLTDPDANNILRSDIRYIAFSTYQQMARSFDGFTTFETSTKPEESWLKDSTIGVLPKVPSGTPAPSIAGAFLDSVNIVNDRYAAIVDVLGDWVRFDQIGKIRQVSAEMGRAARMTEEYAVYAHITTAGNYTRNSTTNDNDIGANTAATTLNGAGLELALATVATSKDRKSGAYLGFNADTFITGPRNQWYARKLLTDPELLRASANNAAEEQGIGTRNPYIGTINKIIVSPWFATGTTGYQWAVVDSRARSFVYQTVEPFNVFQEDAGMTSEAWLVKDVVRYLVQGYFGLGLIDDRAWYYSSSTTAPTVS